MQVSDTVPISMRNGVASRPSSCVLSIARRAKAPTIMIKTPYTASMELLNSRNDSLRLNGKVVAELLRRRYALVVVIDRGTGWWKEYFTSR